MASSACSVHFLSLTTNNLSLSNSRPGAVPLPLTSASLAAPLKSLSVCSSFLRPYEALPSRLVRKVAFSSELDVSENLESNSPSPALSPDVKLFVGNLPFSVDSATLAGLFEDVGNVEVVEVIYDKMTGRSRGFGFVTMSTPEEAEAAANKFNGYELEGRELRVNAGPPPPKGESSFGKGPRSGGGSFGSNNNRLYVGNLAWGVDEAALETLFSEQGKVLEAKVVYDRETGRSRGFGFVTYSSVEEVNSAIEVLNGVELNGRAIQVNVAESKPRRPF